MNSKTTELAKLAGGLLGRAVYSKATGGRSWDADRARVEGYTKDPSTLALDAGNWAWNTATGRSLYGDVQTVTDTIGSARRALENPTEFVYDSAKRKITGQPVSDDSLLRLVKYVLSDQADSEFTVTDQENLHKISKGKLKGRYIDALYDPRTGKYIDRKIASVRGKKYVAQIHEKLEEKSGRPDDAEHEQEHVNLHVAVLQGLRKAYAEFEGEMKGRAREGIQAYYQMLDETTGNDELFSRIRQKVPERRTLAALDGIEL